MGPHSCLPLQCHTPLGLAAAKRGHWDVWTSSEPVGNVYPSTSATAILLKEPSMLGAGLGNRRSPTMGNHSSALGFRVSVPSREQART